MSRDQITLLVGVDGFVLAALLVAVAFLQPSRSTDGAPATVDGEPERPARERLLFPFLDGLQALGVRLSPAGAAAKMQKRLDIAGNPTAWSVERVFAMKGLLMIGGGLLGLLFGHGLLSLTGLAWTVGLGLSGFFLPDVLLYNTGTKRQQQIRRTLPDVVDLLSVTMKAGLGFDAAMARVARVSAGPLAAEFARYLQEIRLGESRVSALLAMSGRSTVVDLHHVLSSLVQADQLGIPVAKVLAAQSREMRVRRRQRAEEQAQKVTIKIIFPTLMCIFPALFVVIIGPGMIRIGQTFMGTGGFFGG